MDFTEALDASGLVIIIILLVSLIVYMFRVREIYGELTLGTRRALWGYGLSGLGMVLATFVGLYEPFRFLVMGVGAFFLGSILVAQQWVLFSPGRAQKGQIITILMVVVAISDNFLRLRYPDLPMFGSIIPVTIFIIGTSFFAIILIRESPSTFTVSIFVMMVLYMMTWVLAATRWTFDNPQFYIFQTIPLVVAAAIFGSVRRPLRFTLSLFMVLLMITVNIPLVHASTLSGQPDIYIFVLTESIVLLCFIAPLNYFIQQASETGAKTPRYLAMVVAFISALIVWYSLGWAMFIDVGFWNQYMVWIEIVLGSLAVTAFLLAAVASAFGDWVYAATREGSIIYATILGMLSFPIIKEGIMTSIGLTSVIDYNNYIMTAIVAGVLIGFMVYVRIAYKLYKNGAGSAAQRLMLFLVAAIMTAFSTMVSDDIFVAGLLYLDVIILLTASLLALASSPPFTARFIKFMQQRRVKDAEEEVPESALNWQ